MKKTTPANFDEFFDDYFAKALFVPPFAMDEPAIKVDVRESRDAVVVRATIPGARKEAIAVDYRDGVVELTVPKTPA